jgi:hypothetical protein
MGKTKKKFTIFMTKKSLRLKIFFSTTNHILREKKYFYFTKKLKFAPSI